MRVWHQELQRTAMQSICLHATLIKLVYMKLNTASTLLGKSSYFNIFASANRDGRFLEHVCCEHLSNQWLVKLIPPSHKFELYSKGRTRAEQGQNRKNTLNGPIRWNLTCDFAFSSFNFISVVSCSWEMLLIQLCSSKPSKEFSRRIPKANSKWPLEPQWKSR